MNIRKPILILSLIACNIVLHGCSTRGGGYYDDPNPVNGAVNKIKNNRVFSAFTGEPGYSADKRTSNFRFVRSLRENNPLSNTKRYLQDRSTRNGASGSYVGGAPAKSGKSYYFANRATPKSHKQVDNEWIDSQNPSGYTIEIASGDSAQDVAKTLFKTPKEQRMAQYKQEYKGKTVHKGIYGSFASQDAAKEALSKLPDDVKDKAKVKSWGKAQDEVKAGKRSTQDPSLKPPSVGKEPKQANGASSAPSSSGETSSSSTPSASTE